MIQPEHIWNSSSLPTLPAVATRLLDLMRCPETVISDVVQIVKVDPAISAKLIKAANSSYFGLRSEVKTIERAVPLLGTTAATTLALSFALTDDALQKGSLSGHYQAYWKQSIVQAAAAERFAAKFTDRDPSEFFLAGLLLDIGRLAMLKTIPQTYGPFLETLGSTAQSLAEQETSAIGCHHAQIGARLLQNWKFPTAIVQAVEYHELPIDELAKLEQEADFLLYSILAFAGTVGEYLCGSAQGQSLQRLRAIAARWFSLDHSQLEHFLSDCNHRIQQSGDLLHVNMAGVESSTELMLQANEQLVQLALQAQAVNTQAELQNAELIKEKTRLEEDNRLLQSKAIHDSLTKLYNRNFFDEALARECHQCQRQAEPLAIIMADIDHFKSVNDTYGHLGGDAILSQVASRMQGSIRNTDIIARHGGEEFVILVHKPTDKGLATLSERLRAAVADAPFVFEGRSLSVTCSLGTAIAIPGRRERNIGHRLITSADQALYAAKSAGRNRVSATSLVSEEDRRLNQQVTSQRYSRWLVQRNLLEIATVSRALLDLPIPIRRVGEIAVEMGFLEPLQVQRILEAQAESDDRFGTIAIRLGMLTADQLVCALAMQHEDPKQLTSSIIRLGLLSPELATAALEEYMQAQFSVAVPASMS